MFGIVIGLFLMIAITVYGIYDDAYLRKATFTRFFGSEVASQWYFTAGAFVIVGLVVMIVGAGMAAAGKGEKKKKNEKKKEEGG